MPVGVTGNSGAGRPKRRRRRGFGLSLRAKLLAIIAGGAVFAVIATLVLVLAVRQADGNLARASAAQAQLERLISLSGRISDYGLRALQAREPGGALEHGHVRVSAIFAALEAGVARQVSLVSSDTAQNAAATKSLMIARMRAQFEALHKTLLAITATEADREAQVARSRAAMDAFGVGFSPLLSQAVEDERGDARAAREAMVRLREQVGIFAVFWVLSAALAVLLTYLMAGRSILTRIAETVRGAHAISSGRLDRRLDPAGRDELTLLMARFNRMADNLTRRETRLLTAQQALKETVAARTSDLEDAKSRLEEIDGNRRRFFSDISHELRTPLTVILGEADVSLRHIGPDAETPVGRALETNRARAVLLRRRIDDLLRVARSESGRLDLVFGACDLNGLIEKAIAEVASLSAKCDVSIDFQPSPANPIVSADEDWFRQIITGLFVNALKYAPRSSQVQVRTWLEDQRVRIEIRDQGSGIEAQDLPHVFNRFYRGRNQPETSETGHGVGLALVKWVVTEHDGEVTVQSPANSADRSPGTGPGTSVTVELPLYSESETSTSPT